MSPDDLDPDKEDWHNPYQDEPTTAEKFDDCLILVLLFLAIWMVADSEVAAVFLNRYIFKF